MAAEFPGSTPSDLPPNVDYAKDPATGRTYYIDHTNETTSWVHPYLKAEVPSNFDCRMDIESGKIFFVDHANKTASWSHPCHKDFHLSSTSNPDLPYPYEQCLDAKGRHFYKNHESKTVSWMHPIKLGELKAAGILDDDIDVYRGKDGQAWKAWILEDIAECGLNKGTPYFVDYRTGTVDWQSPDNRRIAHQKALERAAARSTTEEQNKDTSENYKPRLEAVIPLSIAETFKSKC